jgi:hypothetical protein
MLASLRSIAARRFSRSCASSAPNSAAIRATTVGGNTCDDGGIGDGDRQALVTQLRLNTSAEGLVVLHDHLGLPSN